jgi:hypothetical protein
MRNKNKQNNSHKNKAQNHTDKSSFSDLSDVTLTQEEAEALLFMIEEEKMAMDIYDTLYEATGITTFDKISDSESKHYNTLLNLAENLDLDTSSLSTDAGLFENDEIQSLYDSLIEKGLLSDSDAIEVGIAIEETDIADLIESIESTDIATIENIYNHLLEASQHHLSVFENIA